MQVTGGKRQAALGDGIKYPPGGGKEPLVLRAVSPRRPGGIAFASIGGAPAEFSMKCRALIVGIQTIRPPWRAVSRTAYSFRPPTG